MGQGIVDNEKGTPVTQAAFLAPIGRQSKPIITQSGILVTYRPPPSPTGRVNQHGFLVAHRQPASTGVRVTQSALQVLGNSEDNVAVNVTQAALLIAWKTGVEGQTRQRAWTFDFDGHTFYVLDLAQEGTWLYDFTTGQWSQFDTPGYGVWNFINGYAWESNRMVVAGDSIYSIVSSLDPASHFDDGWRPVEYKVTAGISTRDRNGKSVDSVRLAVSAGYMVDPMPTITMKFSDNNGATWSQDYPFQLVSGEYTQRVEWNSLGQITIPGRVFEFTDQGGLIRIDAADAQIEGQE